MSFFNSDCFQLRSWLVLFCCIALGACASKQRKPRINTVTQQVEQLYNKGKRALDQGNYAFATQYYQALTASYPYGEYTEQAKLDMIYAFNKSGQVEEAIEAADNFMRLYPTHRNVDYAYYMKGVASFDKKQSRIDRFMRGGKNVIRDSAPLKASEEAFNELIKRYPDSIYAEDAEQRIVYIRNKLAERELVVAQFYFDRKSYVATLNRCKNIIYKYERTPTVEGALALMEKAYKEMGLDELAVSTHEVLAANFPDAHNQPYAGQKKGFFRQLNLLSLLNPF